MTFWSDEIGKLTGVYLIATIKERAKQNISRACQVIVPVF